MPSRLEVANQKLKYDIFEPVNLLLQNYQNIVCLVPSADTNYNSTLQIFILFIFLKLYKLMFIYIPKSQIGYKNY